MSRGEENMRIARLIERLASLEHEQWVYWAKGVLPEVSEERKKRWWNYFVPYEELPNPVKKLDRKWAYRVIEILEDEGILPEGTGASVSNNELGESLGREEA